MTIRSLLIFIYLSSVFVSLKKLVMTNAQVSTFSVTQISGNQMSQNVHAELEVPEGATTWAISISKGIFVTLKFRGNPTAGYQWLLLDFDNVRRSFLKPLNLDENGASKEFRENDFTLIGSPGVFLFNFIPVKSSDGIVLHFVYKRPGEKNIEKEVYTTVKII